jgi:putative transposase
MTTLHFHRRSIRLRDYDYTQNGAYFVTLCTHRRAWWFGDVVGGEMQLNAWGEIVLACWEAIPAHYPKVELDGFVVMPNHMHGIIVLTDERVGQTPNKGIKMGMIYHAPTNAARQFSKPVANSLGSIIGAFKAAVTRQINRLPNPPDDRLWQRNYYEKVIRDQAMLDILRAYVINNPNVWEVDSLYGPEIL